MKEINIARTLIAKRKERGITQDDLAAYIGVSKASVSKWETSQSYPDITFLPQLATFFNITVDELIGYAPQLTKEDIRKLYRRLAADFGTEPFEPVMEKCREAIHKYYSCFPLLLQMAVLLINHHMLAGDPERQAGILGETVELCARIKKDSEDVWLSRQANSIEALCQLILQKPAEVLELLDGTMRATSDDSVLLASAYQMTGDLRKAKEVMQVTAYQHLAGLAGSMPSLLLQAADDAARFEETVHRVLSVADLFHLEKLHPNTLAQICLAIAQGYAAQGLRDKALDMLQKYAGVCTTGFFPLKLHGDGFFDAIDGWLEELDLGTSPVRDERLVKASMVQVLEANPGFSVLADHPRYRIILETLKSKLGGN